MSKVKEMAEEYNSLAADGATEARKQRIDVRVSASTKALLEAEAAFRGLTLSAYLVGVGVEDATRTMERRRYIELGTEDSDAFFAALDAAARPSRALKKAAAFHKENVASDA